jgi:hypothetical protein
VSAGILPRPRDLPKLTAVRHPTTQKILTEPAEAIVLTTEHFASELSKATPETLPIPPWEDPNNPDTYELKPHTPSHSPLSQSLENILTRNHYTIAVQGSSQGKAPGPDTIPNEIIKNLPEEVHNIIFDLFTLMARLNYTPQEWCRSDTCLLYKPH